jgi:hypothetical protein
VGDGLLARAKLAAATGAGIQYARNAAASLVNPDQLGMGNYRNTVTEGHAVLHESCNTVCDEKWIPFIRVRGL